MKKIVFCLDFYYPHIGGGEVLFTRLAEGLVKRGWEVTVVTQRVAGTVAQEVIKGVNVRRVQSFGCRYLFALLCLPTLLMALRQAAVLHATTFASTLPAWLASKLTGVPLVLTVHEVWIGKWRQVSDAGWFSNVLNNLIEHFVYCFDYQHYVAVSQATARDLVTLCKVPEEAVTTIYNGVDYTFWDPAKASREGKRGELGLKGGQVFFFSGRPGCSKGLPVLLRALAELAKRRPSVRLVAVVGNGPSVRKGYREACRLIRELGIEKQVVLREPVPLEELRSLVACADTVVVPSLSEGFGFAAAEACALGRPVIATDNASLPEVVSGDYLLVPPRDVPALAAAMERAVKRDYDHKEPKKFLLQDMLNGYNELYGRILGNSDTMEQRQNQPLKQPRPKKNKTATLGTGKVSSWHVSFSQLLAFLYAVLLMVPVSIGERAYAHDVLVPVMACTILIRSRLRLKDLLFRHWLLAAFLAVSLIATAVHSFSCIHDSYEWLVFAYMAVVFVFYAETPFSLKVLKWGGLGMATAIMLTFLADVACVLIGWPTHFCFLSEQMTTTSMSLLSCRYAFFHGNPNLFGVFAALPAVLLARWLQTVNWRNLGWRLKAQTLLAFCGLLLPLGWSASKHGLLTAALLGGMMPLMFRSWRKPLKCCVLAAVLLLATVFETTVLYTVFPLTSSAPYINTLPGMYSLHQGVYTQMIFDTKHGRIPLGYGASQAQKLYSKYVQPEVVKETLTRYNAMPSYENFLTFMDPHNEYLNLTVLFGFPACLLMLLFWLHEGVSRQSVAGFIGLMFVIALLCCCLWDDLLSKRALWVAAAMLFNRKISDKI